MISFANPLGDVKHPDLIQALPSVPSDSSVGLRPLINTLAGSNPRSPRLPRLLQVIDLSLGSPQAGFWKSLAGEHLKVGIYAASVDLEN